MTKAASEETFTEVKQEGNRYLRQPYLARFGSKGITAVNQPVCQAYSLKERLRGVWDSRCDHFEARKYL